MQKITISDVSTYRSQIMGIATIFIIICHAPFHISISNNVLEKILMQFGVGVDIFLIMSGFGLYYSLMKKSRLALWYRHRFIKLLVPYLVFAIPVYGYYSYVADKTICEYLLDLSTLSYWTKGWGLWFISFLIPIYLTAPLIFYIVNSKHWKFVTSLVILFAFLCGTIPIRSGIPSFLSYASNCFMRYPSFLVGMLMAREVFINEGNILKFICINGGGYYCFIYSSQYVLF